MITYKIQKEIQCMINAKYSEPLNQWIIFLQEILKQLYVKEFKWV